MLIEEALTIPEAAERIAPSLGLSPYTVAAYMREAIRRSELQTYRKGNKERQYLKIADVDAYKERQQVFVPVTDRY